jgi:tetratricopeptide (TPR) repeat protein
MQIADLKRQHDCVEHGDLRDSQGEFEKAIKAYDRALRIIPEDADVLFNKGQTLQKMGRLGEAQKCYEQAIRMYVGT